MRIKTTHLFTNESTKNSFANPDGIGRIAITIEGQDHTGKAARVTITLADIYEAMSLAKNITREVEAVAAQEASDSVLRFRRAYNA